MPSIDELRARSADLFADLARGRAGAERATAGRERPFSWFNPDDAAQAVGLAALLAVVSGAAPTEDVGLQRALDLAAAQSAELPPELVTQAMAIFVTHHRPARQLAKPRTIRVEPELFMPSRPADAPEPEGAPDPERALDYWREDPFANEHHGHWHQVIRSLVCPCRTGSCGRRHRTGPVSLPYFAPGHQTKHFRNATSTCSTDGRPRSIPRSPTANCSGRSGRHGPSTATRSTRPSRLRSHS
jgi:hypothetical protein